MNRKSLLFLCCFLMAIFATAAFAISIPINAQDVPSETLVPEGEEEVPVTLEPTLEAQIAATQAAQDAEWVANFASRTIFDFRLAYLITEDASIQGTVVSSENMREYLGAITIHSWDEFMELNNQQPFNMILIHASMVEIVDTAWMSTAYRNEIFIVGIDVRREQLGEIVGDKCHGGNGKETLDFVDHNYLYFAYDVILENEEYRDAVHKISLEDCTEDYQGIGKARIMHGTNEIPIATEEELSLIANSLVAFTVNFHIAKSGVLPLPTSIDSMSEGN